VSIRGAVTTLGASAPKAHNLLSLRALFGVESAPSSALKLARDIIYSGKIQASF